MPDPMLPPGRGNGHHPELTNNTSLVRADLARSRHRFEAAADAVRADLEAIRALTQWRVIVRSKPFIGLAVAVAAGLALGIFLASRRD